LPDQIRSDQMAKTAPFPVSGMPAMLGGDPVFPEGLALVRPSLPPESVIDDIRKILSGHVLTNGPYVRELEERAADYLGVRHCVAVSSCTSGLMLVLRVTDLTGEVVIPSFTFAATAHAVEWNGLRPVFADIDPETLLLSPKAVRGAIGVHTSAILATHTYGTPCDTEGLSEVARAAGIRLFFDAAHAFGSQHQGKRVGGFGDAEVFSLSPTKVLVASEGGIIATNDEMLAERCRIGRDYGNPGDYDCRFVGLNARMSEVHAAIALGSLTNIDERIGRRNALAGLYREALEGVPGVSFPLVPDGDRSTYKDFTMLVDPDGFGLDAAGLQRALSAEGIESRRYYSPPVHVMRAYQSVVVANGSLPVTDSAAGRVLTLPMWTGMSERHVARVADAIDRIRRFVG
jgi:dTDP-4-amino-4,6-dideoxygalactose transaminase